MDRRLAPLLVCVALAALASWSAQAQEATSVFGGFNTQKKSDYVYLGGVHAFRGNLDRDDWLLRAVVGGGKYDYTTTGVAGGRVSADQSALQIGGGYQWADTARKAAIYVSADWQDHRLSPSDPGNSIRGSKSGVAVQGEWKTEGPGNHLGLIGQVSSVFGSYWARARYGFAVAGMHVGPELVATGNREYRAGKLGAHMEWSLTKATSLDVSFGASDSKGKKARDSINGGYAGANLSYRF